MNSFSNQTSSVLSFEDYNRNFISFVQKISHSSVQYSQAYIALFDQIKPQKCLAREVPNIETIKKNYQIFLQKKSRNQKEVQILKYWSHKHLEIFLFILACYQCLTNHSPEILSDIHWRSISQLLPHTKPESLKYKWACLQANSLTLNHWTQQEDEVLRIIISEKNPELLQNSVACDHYPSSLGGETNISFSIRCNRKVKWSFIAMELNQRANKSENYMNISPKLGKHCRERWFNHLTPTLKKTEWTDADDLLLMELAMKYDRKWAKISHHFPGRTQHSVKNRYLSLIAREYKISRKKLSPNLICSKFLLQNTLTNLKKRLGENEETSRFENKFLEFDDQQTIKKDETISSLDEELEKFEKISEDFSEYDFKFQQEIPNLKFENQNSQMEFGMIGNEEFNGNLTKLENDINFYEMEQNE